MEQIHAIDSMSSIALAWWVWLLSGLALMAGELLFASGFFVFFVGLGCIVTSLLALTGLTASLEWQGISFVCVSLFGVFALRKPLLAKFHIRNRVHTVDSIVGQLARTLEPIAPLAFGRVEMRGSSWTALNSGPETLPAHAQCRVERVEGLTLHVR